MTKLAVPLFMLLTVSCTDDYEQIHREMRESQERSAEMFREAEAARQAAELERIRNYVSPPTDPTLVEERKRREAEDRRRMAEGRQPLEPGDSAYRVVEKMGQPLRRTTSTSEYGETVMLVYPTATVWLRDGRVTHIVRVGR